MHDISALLSCYICTNQSLALYYIILWAITKVHFFTMTILTFYFIIENYPFFTIPNVLTAEFPVRCIKKYSFKIIAQYHDIYNYINIIK